MEEEEGAGKEKDPEGGGVLSCKSSGFGADGVERKEPPEGREKEKAPFTACTFRERRKRGGGFFDNVGGIDSASSAPSLTLSWYPVEPNNRDGS